MRHTEKCLKTREMTFLRRSFLLFLFAGRNPVIYWLRIERKELCSKMKGGTLLSEYSSALTVETVT